MLVQSQGLSCLSLNSTTGWAGDPQEAGTQRGQLTTTDCRDIPQHVVSCSAYESGEGRRKGAMFRVMAFVSPITFMHGGPLLSQ